MADTGFNWGSWTQCGVESVTLTTAGTIIETSDAISLDGIAGCEVSIEATYSNHVKATGGLEIYILGECNGTYEAQADGPWGFEMVFTQNSTNRKRINVDPSKYGTFKVHADWNNTTASSNVSITIRYRTCTVPVASA